MPEKQKSGNQEKSGHGQTAQHMGKQFHDRPADREIAGTSHAEIEDKQYTYNQGKA